MKTKLFLISFLFLSTAVFAQTAGPSPSGYNGVPWGTALNDFKASRDSTLTYSVEGMEAWALDFLLMDFHHVDKDDPCRAPKLSAQLIPGDDSVYAFYGGKFCAASVPLDPGNLSKTQQSLKAAHPFLNSLEDAAIHTFFDSYGYKSVFFHYYGYLLNPSTRVYLVKVKSFYEDPAYYGDRGWDTVQSGEGYLEKAFLVYISDDYLKGENAYTDWLENRKNPPAPKLDYLQTLKCGIEH